MPTFASFDGTELWYDDQGEPGRRPAVLLLHGFAADTNINWVRSGILDALVDDDLRTVALDHRGHGLSAKPHEPEAYADDALTRDAQALLDHLGVESVVVIGYSLGSGVALRLGAIDPRVQAVIAIGVGSESIARRAGQNRVGQTSEGDAGTNALGDALLADDPDTITDPLGKRFRILADSIRADRVALAACMSNLQASPDQHVAELRRARARDRRHRRRPRR